MLVRRAGGDIHPILGDVDADVDEFLCHVRIPCCGGSLVVMMARSCKMRAWFALATVRALSGMSAATLAFRRCPASTIFAGWRQSVLPVHLLGLDALLGSVGPVAGDVKLQDDGVVHDPVNRRGGGHGVGKDALPLREDQV